MAEEIKETKVLVTERSTAPENKEILATAGPVPNVEVVSIPAWQLASIRAVRTWLQGVVATIGLLATGGPQAAAIETLKWLDLPVPSRKLTIIAVATFIMPLGTALISLAQNALDYFKQWDKKFPELRG